MKAQSLILTACLTLAAPAAARDPGEAVAPKFEHVIPNIPGKSLIAAGVTFPPGAASLPHHHANSAFIYAYVLSGSIRSQVEGEPARIYRAGESFYEAPGAHHLETLNVSGTEPAKVLAVFVVDTNGKPLTTFDK